MIKIGEWKGGDLRREEERDRVSGERMGQN